MKKFIHYFKLQRKQKNTDVAASPSDPKLSMRYIHALTESSLDKPIEPDEFTTKLKKMMIEQENKKYFLKQC